MTDDNKSTDKRHKWIPPRDGRPVPEIFSNIVQSSWTNYDIRIRLGQLIPEVDYGGDFVVEDRAAVTLSWQHAKYVAKLLSDLVNSFEKTNGDIPLLKLPPDPTPKEK